MHLNTRVHLCLSTNTLLNLYVITITEGQGIALEDHVNVCVRVHTDILK